MGGGSGVLIERENSLTGQMYANWIQKYFEMKEDLEFFDIQGVNDRNYAIEIVHENNSRGYVFAETVQTDDNYEGRMNNVRKQYEKGLKGLEVKIDRIFIDNTDRLAGFSWEAAK
ncbi:MAG TPA: hypothetical protein VJK03_02935 [Candidatus Nanoarchaeia archaeon]|nr:hypothetical protein [Candidatus Nanoarchaeia archaeon]